VRHQPRPGFAAYTAAKDALWALTESLAVELAPAVRELIGNETELRKFRDALQRLDQANALGVMLADIEQLTGGTSAVLKTPSSSPQLKTSAGRSAS